MTLNSILAKLKPFQSFHNVQPLSNKLWVAPLAYSLFGLQWVILLIWNIIRFHRFVLTWDFSIYYQAAYLVSHGHLNPFSTLLGLPFYQNDAEWIIWPLAAVVWLWESPLTMLIVQSTALVLANVLAFQWISEIVEKQDYSKRSWLRILGLAVLLLNPWPYWEISFDFHIEFLITPLVVALAWSLWRGHIRSILIWAGLTLLGGAVATTYVVGMGLSGLLMQGRRWAGLMLIFIGGITFILFEHVPGGIKGGSLIGFYGYLAGPHLRHINFTDIILGAVTHPLRAWGAIRYNGTNLLASIAPSGFVGVLMPAAIGVNLVVLATIGLIPSHVWSTPQLFQQIVMMPLLAVGLVWMLNVAMLYMVRYKWARRRSSSILITGILVINLLLWTGIWTPRIIPHWLLISRNQAHILQKVYEETPPHAEVIASNGVVGRFAGRAIVYNTDDLPGGVVPLKRRTIIFVLTPSAGIEINPIQIQDITALVSRLPHVDILADTDGIWAFRWTVPIGMRHLQIPTTSIIPAWTAGGPSGLTVKRSGHLAFEQSNGRPGYIVDGYYDRVPVGEYQATVTLSNSSPVNLEVWNGTGNVLLARRTVPDHKGIITVLFPVANPTNYAHHSVFTGRPLFHVTPNEPSHDNLNLRVWSDGHGVVKVYQIGLTPTS